MERRVTPERAIEIASSHPIPRVVENVALDQSGDRVLATALSSLVDDPRFDNSAMDGFAVRLEDITEATTLSIV